MLTLSIDHVLTSVSAVEWDGCIAAQGEASNPFLKHAFLLALEQSGCVGARTGWIPAHIVLKNQQDVLQGCAPCYIKTHSMGEYVFDHAWAEAYHRAGGVYYPKLQLSVPFTPATGPRLLVGDQAQNRVLLLQGVEALRAKVGASSIHATFLVEADWLAMVEQGYLTRIDQQFHWLDQGYEDFDGFLEALSSRKRKTIKRERRDALSNNISIEWLRGDAILEEHWDVFYAFYRDTGSKKWGQPYLNRLFFSLIGQSMAQDIVLILAKREGKFIAGAINFIGGSTLYGRHWGCLEDHPFLHFEVCYYQAIDYALANGLTRVEAGAQGDHKLARGYQPVATYSCHYFADVRFQEAVDHYLKQERQAVEALGEQLSDILPFKKI